MFSFDKANAFVIGAASGIGRALALEFSQRGARIAVADIDEAGVAQTAKRINETGGNAVSLHSDITDEQSLANAVAQAEQFLGPIDISVNVVGVLLSGNIEDIPLSEWQRIFQTNVFGAARLNQIMLPKMIAREQGYIVNTASVAGLYPFAITRIPYAASKAALISMSQNLAIHLKPKGIKVSCLCPGPTATPIAEKSSVWTEGAPMYGPGRNYSLKTPWETAQVFCNGLEAERVIIPSDEEPTFDYMRRHAASPDNFIYEKIGQYSCGDTGLPQIDFANPDIIDALNGIDSSLVEKVQTEYLNDVKKR